jgi:hypothetical protein
MQLRGELEFSRLSPCFLVGDTKKPAYKAGFFVVNQELLAD